MHVLGTISCPPHCYGYVTGLSSQVCLGMCPGAIRENPLLVLWDLVPAVAADFCFDFETNDVSSSRSLLSIGLLCIKFHVMMLSLTFSLFIPVMPAPFEQHLQPGKHDQLPAFHHVRYIWEWW